MDFSLEEILETVNMTIEHNFDIRTITLGINIKDCIHSNIDCFLTNLEEKILPLALKLGKVADEISEKYGIPIVNKRISITPLSLVTENLTIEESKRIILKLEEICQKGNIDFMGGIGLLVHKNFTRKERKFLEIISYTLIETQHLCCFLNVADTRTGINMDAIWEVSQLIKKVSENTHLGIGCAKLVVFANAPENNPFMAGAFHGIGEGEYTINVGISGPGVVSNVVRRNSDVNFAELSDIIKKTVFKLTRCGELIGQEIAQNLGVDFGIVDLSLAPTTKIGDSVAEILENMGIEKVGAPGTTAALYLLINAVKKGGMMASAYIGGLSGTFIPVSEDIGMVRAVKSGSLTLEKLEAMTAVCSVGLDMIAVPGDISAESIAGIIADEMAIGVSNNKTTAVRIIPVPGAKEGDFVRFGGLLGETYILKVSKFSSSPFVLRGGFIPPPITSLRN